MVVLPAVAVLAAVVATAYLAICLTPHAPLELAPLPSECRLLGGVDDG